MWSLVKIFPYLHSIQHYSHSPTFPQPTFSFIPFTIHIPNTQIHPWIILHSGTAIATSSSLLAFSLQVRISTPTTSYYIVLKCNISLKTVFYFCRTSNKIWINRNKLRSNSKQPTITRKCSNPNKMHWSNKSKTLRRRSKSSQSLCKHWYRIHGRAWKWISLQNERP